jgi:hypothetical protein
MEIIVWGNFELRGILYTILRYCFMAERYDMATHKVKSIIFSYNCMYIRNFNLWPELQIEFGVKEEYNYILISCDKVIFILKSLRISTRRVVYDIERYGNHRSLGLIFSYVDLSHDQLLCNFSSLLRSGCSLSSWFVHRRCHSHQTNLII